MKFGEGIYDIIENFSTNFYLNKLELIWASFQTGLAGFFWLQRNLLQKKNPKSNQVG